MGLFRFSYVGVGIYVELLSAATSLRRRYLYVIFTAIDLDSGMLLEDNQRDPAFAGQGSVRVPLTR